MKKWAFLLFSFFSAAAFATTTSSLSGYCNLGAARATVSGLPSTNYQQGLIPYCTVTVYLNGTTTLATIYSDSGSTPLTNPFTANADASWLFYAATFQAYDIVLSGGVSPNTYPSPVTVTEISPSLSGQFCPITGCTMTGVLTDSFGFVGPLTGNATTATTATNVVTTAASSSKYYLFGGLTSGASSSQGVSSIGGVTWTPSTNTLNAQNLSGQSIGLTYDVSGFPTSCTVSSVAYTTQFDCAMATANAQILLGNAVKLHVGAGVWSTCTGIQIALSPTSGNRAGFTLVGDGPASQQNITPATVIQQTCAISTPMVYKPSQVSGIGPSIIIKDIQFDANGNAPEVLALYGTQYPLVDNVTLVGVLTTGGSTWTGDRYADLGDPSGSSLGAFYEGHVRLKVDGSTPNVNYGQGAAIFPVISGGVITGYNVDRFLTSFSAFSATGYTAFTTYSVTVTSSGGTCDIAPVVTFRTGSGGTASSATISDPGACPDGTFTASFPSPGTGSATPVFSTLGGSNYTSGYLYAIYHTVSGGTLPTSQPTFTISFGSITAVATCGSSAACVGSGLTAGTVYMTIIGGNQAQSYGVVVNGSDNPYLEIVTQNVGSVASIYNVHAQNTYIHPHMYPGVIGLLSRGEANVYAMECDQVITCFASTGALGYDHVDGTQQFFNSSVYMPGSSKYYVPGEFSSMFIGPDGYSGNRQSGYNLITNASGAVNSTTSIAGPTATEFIEPSRHYLYLADTTSTHDQLDLQLTGTNLHSIVRQFNLNNPSSWTGYNFSGTAPVGGYLGFDFPSGCTNSVFVGYNNGTFAWNVDCNGNAFFAKLVAGNTAVFNSTVTDQSTHNFFGNIVQSSGKTFTEYGTINSANIWGGGTLSSPVSITGTSLTTTGLSFTSVTGSNTAGTTYTLHGHCFVRWQQATAAATVTFGFASSATPTDLNVASRVYVASNPILNYVDIGTSSTPTAVTAAITPAVAATDYQAEFDIYMQTANFSNTVTLYGLTSNASDALVVQKGSYCSYLP